MRRFAAILAPMLTFVAIVLSGGGVARFAHVMIAHGSGPCDGHAHAHLRTHAYPCSHSHAEHAGDGARGEASSERGSGAAPWQPASATDDDCAICAELAVTLLRPQAPLALASTFAPIEIRCVEHRSNAPDPAVLASIAARPPPIAA